MRGSIPLSQTTLLLILAFNPTITSLYFSTASITFSLSIHSILDNSSIRFKPMREIFKRQINSFCLLSTFTKSAMRSLRDYPHQQLSLPLLNANFIHLIAIRIELWKSVNVQINPTTRYVSTR